jgi:hypothetical protein
MSVAVAARRLQDARLQVGFFIVFCFLETEGSTMSNISTSSTTDLAQSAYNLGPFLFSILFVTIVTLLAQRAYVNAKDEKRAETFRVYFYASFIFGFLLVITSVGWWIFDQYSAKWYVYKVGIQGFDKDSVVFSPQYLDDNIYSQDSSLNNRNMTHFVFLSHRRFRNGEHIPINASDLSSIGDRPPLASVLDTTIDGSESEFSYANGKLTRIGK